MVAKASLSNQCRNWSTARLSANSVVRDMISEADAENTSLAPHIKGVNLLFQKPWSSSTFPNYIEEQEECTPCRGKT